MVHYLVKERGIKLDVAQEMIRHNHSGVSRHRAMERLQSIRMQLTRLLAAIDLEIADYDTITKRNYRRRRLLRPRHRVHAQALGLLVGLSLLGERSGAKCDDDAHRPRFHHPSFQRKQHGRRQLHRFHQYPMPKGHCIRPQPADNQLCNGVLGRSAEDDRQRSAPLPDSKLEAENSVVIIPHIDLEIRMIKVKGGSFTMGATFEQGICANFDEKPPVAVTLSDFMIAETPVTQALWESVMSENPSQIQGSDLPVERITWCEAEEFCHRLAQATGHPFRLPSEAQWEYAARGGADSDFTKYAGADDDEVDAHIWHRGNSDGRTHIVGMKEPNELGIYDLSGNVTEWCADWYYNSLAHLHGLTDPEGVPTGRSKVARGGSFDSPLADCRISRRFSLNPNFRSRLIGMRLAL